MSLKKLVLKGFKSFADHTTLEFNEGVTAVVGPNGSGKSNIIEAIQWVMGEQSAKSLRGDRMYDVIFSGTSKRKQMNIAQATLVFDNSSRFLSTDFDEVSVTRRISRSGDSDYFINKQACRLKDIHELFMDSGLGRESFSIISQGQVEAIFNAKAENRRAIFEEAAGVFKYKIQKDEAEKKLETTQDNLDRVKDILFELEKQVGPLAEQADNAKSYLDQKEKLTDLDIRLTVHNIQTQSQKLKESQEKKDNFQENLNDLQNQVAEKGANLSKLQGQLKDKEKDRDQSQADLLNLAKDLERTEANLVLFDEKARHKQAFLDEKTQAISQEEEDIDQVQNRLYAYKRDEDSIKNDLQACKSEYEITKKRINHLGEGKEKRIQDLQDTYVDLMQNQARINNQYSSSERDLSRSQVSLEKYQKELSNLVEEKAQANQLVGQVEEDLKANSQAIEDYLSSYKEVNQSYKGLSQQAKELEQKINHVKSQVSQKEAKLASLKDMQENYTGYFQGVKYILKHREKVSGIVGTVAELIRIPDAYLEAIDTVLGSSSQFVVVKDEASGRQAIRYLKEKRSGRATFLPLTTMKARNIPDKARQSIEDLPGFIGIASDLVDYDSNYSQVIQNLLGNTVVAKDIKAANQIAKSLNYRNRVVSLDGNVMNAGGSMTGGGGKRSSNHHLFSQKKEIDLLSKELGQLKSKLKDDLDGFHHLEVDLKEKINQLEEIKELGDQARYQEKTLTSRLNQEKDRLKRLAKQVQAVQFERDAAQTDLDASQASLSHLAEEKEDLKNKLSNNQTELENLQKEKEVSNEKLQELRDQLELFQNKLSDYREKYASVQATIESLTEQITQGQENLKRLEEDKLNFKNQLTETSKEDLEHHLQELKDKQVCQEKDDQALKEDIKQIEEQIQILSDDLEKERKQAQWLKDQINKEDVALSRVEVNMDHLLDYLVDEYETSFEAARLAEPLDIPLDQANKKVKLLKKGIAELGPVNVGAIEEYKQVKERFDFLSKQHQDLMEAKDSLFDTMDEMDDEVRRRFKVSFDAIREQFNQVFPKMFGGGQADLELTDPDDLLTTGVEIIAQPPGKKLTSLSLLSGGERALTAISLLFAIIQVNPLPFVILDEVEAALDDANVNRFGKYLKEFEEKTQFIVITHRRGTMEESDRLYGVTMEEKGISKLITVGLSEIERMDLEE